jgi:aminoglycoside/choline kinase family phosphotransferase
MERDPAVRRFLDTTVFAEATRRRIQGDASSRVYERLALADKQVILMISPRRPDGPPVRNGKPYSSIAHLAEDVKPFVAMSNGLRQLGLSAPQILDAELAHDLLLIEDLGPETVVSSDPPAPIEERYRAAVDVLVALHRYELSESLAVSPHVEYKLPRYDIDAYLIEVELLLDWYLPRMGVEVTPDMRKNFVMLWRRALQPAIEASPPGAARLSLANLIWLPDRKI